MKYVETLSLGRGVTSGISETEIYRFKVAMTADVGVYDEEEYLGSNQRVSQHQLEIA